MEQPYFLFWGCLDSKFRNCYASPNGWYLDPHSWVNWGSRYNVNLERSPVTLKDLDMMSVDVLVDVMMPQKPHVCIRHWGSECCLNQDRKKHIVNSWLKKTTPKTTILEDVLCYPYLISNVYATMPFFYWGVAIVPNWMGCCFCRWI